mgnify:FL=1
MMVSNILIIFSAFYLVVYPSCISISLGIGVSCKCVTLILYHIYAVEGETYLFTKWNK